MEPTQVLELGGSNWWSIGQNSGPFQVCVRYNELRPDGSADEDSWFVACVTGPGTLDFTRGSSRNMDKVVYFGEGANDFWGTWVFWSNETAGTELQI